MVVCQTNCSRGGYSLHRIPRPTGGESKGFLGNIARAFTVSANRKPTAQEKPILKGIFQAEKGLTDYVLKPLAPPVGYAADAQRKFLEKRYM